MGTRLNLKVWPTVPSRAKIFIYPNTFKIGSKSNNVFCDLHQQTIHISTFSPVQGRLAALRRLMWLLPGVLWWVLSCFCRKYDALMLDTNNKTSWYPNKQSPQCIYCIFCCLSGTIQKNTRTFKKQFKLVLNDLFLLNQSSKDPFKVSFLVRWGKWRVNKTTFQCRPMENRYLDFWSLLFPQFAECPHFFSSSRKDIYYVIFLLQCCAGAEK